MLKVSVFMLLALLSGCASRPVWLENRVACTADSTELHAISKWGPFSIGSQIAPADAAVVCALPVNASPVSSGK
jgi:hypothetical protein